VFLSDRLGRRPNFCGSIMMLNGVLCSNPSPATIQASDNEETRKAALWRPFRFPSECPRNVRPFL
jgi:hypothetical protein